MIRYSINSNLILSFLKLYVLDVALGDNNLGEVCVLH